MRKKILLLTLFLSAMNTMAQSYPFTTEKKEYGLTTCRMNNYVYTNMGIYARLSLAEDTSHGIFLDLYDTGYDVPRQIYEIIGDGKRLNIRVILKNDDVIDYRGHYIGKTEDKVKHGIQINLDSDDSNFRKLTNSNIAAVGVYGLSEKPMIMLLPSFNSAATLKAMYDMCNSSNTSHYSSSATAEMGYICILSTGEIYCRLDNVQIEGAKGKEVMICVSLDDVNTEDNIFVLDKKVTPTYDNSTYKSIILKRSVNDRYSLFPPNGGRFKAYATFYMATGRNGAGGYGKEMVELGKSTCKYITIYRKPSGTWNCY
ncbi:MAG: hypothetical protein IJ069_07065 [Prevotella sp.]|nr:hypothetical protein [Prevotella sp.]